MARTPSPMDTDPTFREGFEEFLAFLEQARNTEPEVDIDEALRVAGVVFTTEQLLQEKAQ